LIKNRRAGLLKDVISTRRMKQVLKLAGLSEKYNLYSLRHSCATLLLQEKVNPKRFRTAWSRIDSDYP
jgi:site-specific recombinase XerD